jgi:hypothetical protein
MDGRYREPIALTVSGFRSVEAWIPDTLRSLRSLTRSGMTTDMDRFRSSPTFAIGWGVDDVVILDLVSDRRERRVSGIHASTVVISKS